MSHPCNRRAVKLSQRLKQGHCFVEFIYFFFLILCDTVAVHPNGLFCRRAHVGGNIGAIARENAGEIIASENDYENVGKNVCEIFMRKNIKNYKRILFHGPFTIFFHRSSHGHFKPKPSPTFEQTFPQTFHRRLIFGGRSPLRWLATESARA